MVLVITRKVSESLVINSGTETWTVTILKVKRRAISILVHRAAVTHPGEMEIFSALVRVGETIKLAAITDLILIDIRRSKVRLGFDGPPQALGSVYRFELCESTQFKWPTQSDDDDSDEEPGGSPVSRRPSPSPPPRNVQLQEPREDTDGGE